MPKTFTQITAANATAGNAILASDHSSAFTTLNSHTVPPMVKAKRSANVAYTSSTAIPWDAEDYDTDAMHDNATNNTRITFQTAGIYRVTASVLWSFGAPNISIVDLSIYGNGVTVIGQNYTQGISASTNLAQQVTAVVDSATYSYVTVQIGLIGGSSYNITADPRTWFSAEWIGLKA
jgi:hypothetical protein